MEKGKRRIGKYPKAFRLEVLERMKTCDSVSQLASELDLNRALLYRWRLKMQANEEGGPNESTPMRKLQKQNQELTRILAEKTLEVDFFKGALQKIEARRQKSTSSGETASTTKSGS